MVIFIARLLNLGRVLQSSNHYPFLLFVTIFVIGDWRHIVWCFICRIADIKVILYMGIWSRLCEEFVMNPDHWGYPYDIIMLYNCLWYIFNGSGKELLFYQGFVSTLKSEFLPKFHQECKIDVDLHSLMGFVIHRDKSEPTHCCDHWMTQFLVETHIL